MVWTVNSAAYLVSIALTVAGALSVFWKRQSERRDSAQNNGEFRGLQKLFLTPYFVVLFAESLQAPYLYVLYHSYRYVPSQIAALYVTGLISNIFFSLFVVRLLSIHGRKALCLACLAAGVFACILKFSDSFLFLFIGRILDGLAAALVTSPFQQWYTHCHVVQFDFPVEWLSSTFWIVATGASFLSVSAGWSSEIIEGIFHVTAFPFAVAALAMIGAGCYIGSKWTENKSTDEPVSLAKNLGKAMSVFKTKPVVLVLCVITCFVEAAIQIFVFIWAPIFLKAKSHENGALSYGVIYAALLSSSLVGSLFFGSELTKKVPVSRLLTASLGLGSVFMWRAYSNLPDNPLEWKNVDFEKIFFLFCLFEIAVGVYTPAINMLQAEILPPTHRPSLLAIVRIPVMVTSSAAILYLHPMTDGQHSIVATATGLLLIACFLSLLLDMVLTRRGQNISQADPDHFTLPKNSLNAHPTVHQVPSKELR